MLGVVGKKENPPRATVSYLLNKGETAVLVIPIVNYGVAIAMMHGILERSLEPFPQILELL